MKVLELDQTGKWYGCPSLLMGYPRMVSLRVHCLLENTENKSYMF